MKNSDKVLRFVVGNTKIGFSSVWRFWINKNDVYIAARNIAGEIKTSLHATGECKTSFTQNYYYNEKNKNILIKNPTRHIKEWRQKKFVNGGDMLLNINIPHRKLRTINFKYNKSIKTIEPINGFTSTQISIYKKHFYPSDGSWYGKKYRDSKLLFCSKLNNTKYICMVIYGSSEKTRTIKPIPEGGKDWVMRALKFGVNNDGVGYIIDT